MNQRIFIFSTFLLFVIVYVGGCRMAGLWLVKKDDIIHADGIVVLMGSISDRILQAADLYQSGLADLLFIVEVEMDGYEELKARGADIISSSRQAGNTAIALGIPAEKVIILPGGAQSTQQEAMIIREYIANKPEIDTLLLVTSAHHMRRAYMIFKNTLRKSQKDICLYCIPSSYTDFNAKKWWKSKDGIEIVLLEYLKLMNFVLFESRN
ncbi:MAG: YdcF family protein [Bacteroidales bacterium]|nr:YdcF family protein [Bacteroidales bacterium]